MGYYGWRDDPVSGASIYQAYIANMSRFAIWSINQGYKIRFLIGQNKDQRAVNDILSVVTRDINSPDEAIFATMIETSEELIHAISETDIVIATRFHNAIFAIMLGRPVITIGYSSKFEALLSDIGLAGYSQQIEQLDIELLKSQFESVVQHYVEIQELILKKSQRYRQLLDKQYDDLFPLCQEPDSEKLRKLQVT
jgi:polysaccharide pyruvyl transferase WcaK-like protein